MQKPPTGRELATEMCRRLPGATTHALARKLREEHPERFATKNAADLAIRRARGAQGKKSRAEQPPTAPRPHGKTGWKPECPPSLAEDWGPIQIDGPAKVLVLSDIHVPYHSKEAVEAAVKYGKRLKPDVVLLDGDICDFYRISRFQQDPKKRDLASEIGYARDLLSWIRGQFRNARIIYKMGNHDERWDVYIWNRAPELFNLDCVQLHNVLEFENVGLERVGDNPVICGKLPVLHGHELGRGLYAPVNPARTAFLKMLDTCLIGHLHRSSSNSESDWKHNETVAWSMGCLCGLSPEFARVNRWNRGFAFVNIAADNQFDLHNLRLSSDFKVRTA